MNLLESLLDPDNIYDAFTMFDRYMWAGVEDSEQSNY